MSILPQLIGGLISLAGLQPAPLVPPEPAYPPQYDRAVQAYLSKPPPEPPKPAPAPPAPKPAPRKEAPLISGDVLDRIAKCESGGRPTAVSASGKYRGAWQFDLSTWQANGGTGDPINFSYAEQKVIASNLYAKRGGAPWPNCA